MIQSSGTLKTHNYCFKCGITNYSHISYCNIVPNVLLTQNTFIISKNMLGWLYESVKLLGVKSNFSALLQLHKKMSLYDMWH